MIFYRAWACVEILLNCQPELSCTPLADSHVFPDNSEHLCNIIHDSLLYDEILRWMARKNIDPFNPVVSAFSKIRCVLYQAFKKADQLHPEKVF